MRENVWKLPATSRQMANGLSVTHYYVQEFNNLFKLLKTLALKKFHRLHTPVSNLSSCNHVNTIILPGWLFPGSQIFPPRKPQTRQIEVGLWVQLDSGGESGWRIFSERVSLQCHISTRDVISSDSSGHKTETVSSYSNSCGERSQCWPSVALRGLKVKTWYWYLQVEVEVEVIRLRILNLTQRLASLRDITHYVPWEITGGYLYKIISPRFNENISTVTRHPLP